MTNNNPIVINNQNSENKDKSTENQENTIKNKTAEEILINIANNVFEYYKENKENFKWKSFEEIFLMYSENNKNMIEQINLFIWKEISFEDIKKLYLKVNYTLEETLTKDIFKHFKQKKAIKSIIKIFQKKINEQWFNLNFEQFLGENIENNSDIDAFFNKIRNYLQKQLQNLPEEQKEKIKNIKTTNDEIINMLISDGIIKNSNYLSTTIEELKNITDERIKEDIENILNIESTLLNANIINNIYDIEKWFSKFQEDLLRIEWLWSFSEKLKKYSIKSATNDEINNIFYKHIFQNLNDEDKNFIKDTENNTKSTSWKSKASKENIILEFKKQHINKLLNNNPNIYIEYVKNHENENNENWLSSILAKILNNQTLTNQDISFIINKLFKKEYIENISRIISKWFNLTKEQQKIYENILSQLLDPMNNSINLSNWIIIQNIQKTLILPEIKNIEELFEIEPIIRFEISWDSVNYFKNIFSNYFTRINNEDYSIFTKVKIKDTDWNEYTWYIQENLNWIEIYEKNPIDNKQNPLKILEKYKVKNIELLEENKLLLDTRSDLRKLSIWVISYFEDKKKDYSLYKIKEKIDKINKNQQNNIKNINKNTDYEIDIEKFKKEWSRLEWDENANFKVWSIIQLKWKSLDWPWITSNWFYGEIIDINKQTWYFKLKIYGWWLLELEEWEWNIFDIPMNLKLLTKIKFNNSWNIFKFNKINNIEEFTKNLKDINIKSDSQWLQKGLSLWSNNIEVKNNKLVRKNEKWEYEEIRYIWNIPNLKINNLDEIRNTKKSINEKFNVWEIEVKNNNIILKYPYDKNFSKKIDLNTFLMIIMYNKLEPWSEKDFRNSEKNISYNPKENNKKITLFSFSHILLSFKQLKQNFLYYYKEDDELKAAEMYAKIAWFLPDLWFLWDIKMEAMWEKESRIWKIIENAKARLERAWEWKWKNHGKVASNIIKDEIFEKVKNWNKLNYRTRLKVAWYLMYAIEKWPWPYFRALANYEWQWLWVKALFGEDHYNKWKIRNQQLQNQLRKNPQNEIIRNELIKSEMFYIKDIPEWSNLYTANFWATIEWSLINSVYNWWKVNEAYEWESWKWNYSMIQDAFKAYVVNNRAPNSLWAFKALSESIDNYEDYLNFYRIVTSLIFTWYIYNNFSSSFMSQFKQICRTYWIPIWLFWDNLNSINKILKIFDYIVKQKNIKPWWKDSFTEFLYWVKKTDNIDIFSIRSKTQRENIMLKIEEFWKLHWEDIVSSFDYTDMTLIEWIWDKNAPKEVIDEYFKKVNDEITEDFSFNDNLFKTAYAPYYQNWIFNIPVWTFKHIALELDNWEFSWKNKSIAEWVWKGIENKLEWIQDIMYNNKVYQFLLKKFINWFWRFYTHENELKLIKALKLWDRDQINDIIIDFNKQMYWCDWKIPPEMEAWLIQFVKTFEKRPENINEVLNNVFWEDKVKNALI